MRWSYELLDPAERTVLERASVFAGEFDLASYSGVFDGADEIMVLRSLDRLVRSSLLVADHAQGRVRYRLLETIRQFGSTSWRASSLEDARDRHAGYFAREAVARWVHWNGPGWRAVVDWLKAELANLRSAFRWSTDRELEVAADIAAHAAMIGTSANLFEPIGWAERLLESATTADIRRLPRLYAAAGFACFVGRPATAVANADRAMALEAEPGYDPCDPGLSAFIGALANVYAGDLDRYVELASAAAAHSGPGPGLRAPGVGGRAPVVRTGREAVALIDDAIGAAREVGNPFWLVYALWIAGITLAKRPQTRIAAWDEGVELVSEYGVDFFRDSLPGTRPVCTRATAT